MTKKQFRLSKSATKQLDKYFAEIRSGIENVSEMHKYDSNPSMKQAEFEKLYIERVLGQPIVAISASLRAMADALAAQKEAEAQRQTHDNSTPESGMEDA